MICPACGVESAPGQFCSNCGAELPVAETFDQSATETIDQYDETHEQDQQSMPEDFIGDDHSTTYAQTEDSQASYTEQVYDQAQEPSSDPVDDLFSQDQQQEGTQSTADDLFADQEEMPVAATDDLFSDAGATSTAKEDNEFVDKTRKAASNFGSFIVDYLKAPTNAINVTKDDLISSGITLGVFSLLVSINIFIMYRKVANMLGQGSFVDGFLIPFISVIILFAIAIGVTFAAVSITHQSISIMDLVAKFGALAVPFLSLYVVAFIVSLIGLTKFYVALSMASFIGMIIVIPTIIILQQSSKRFDQVFVLLGMTLINLIAFGIVMNSFIESIIIGVLGSMFGGFS